jgi:hypothetical protein
MTKHQLMGHWPLQENASDVTGKHHGVAHQVTFVDGPGGSTTAAAQFNGPSSLIEVPAANDLQLANKDFSITTWVRCDTPMRGVFGEALSKFDPNSRCGFNLQVAGSTAGYSAMSDSRHIHFGIDDGYIGPWTDCGKPWPSNSLVSALVAYEGELYASIADADDPMDAARVFRWVGETEWEDCGRLGNDSGHLSVQSMIVHDGRLYAGTGVWDWVRASGDGFEPALSRVFVYEGGRKWRDLGPVGTSVRVLSLASFNGDLYAGLDRVGGGHCFKYDGQSWTDCGAPDGDNFENLFPVDGVLYGATHRNHYRYDGGQSWTCLSREPHGITQTHAFQTYQGKLWAGTWPQGYVLRWEGSEWANTGRLGIPEGDHQEINEINNLIVYNGKLYAGVIPKAQVWRYETEGHWTLMNSLASRPDYTVEEIASWCRVPTMTAYRGRLFAGTGSCISRAIDVDPDHTLGRVYAIELGQTVSHDHDIGTGWTHVTAIRLGRELQLYVNGEHVATSQAPDSHTFDLTNPRPLTIGAGPQGTFAGCIADLRLYNGVLNDNQVKAIASL